jgi:hypothetical protein
VPVLVQVSILVFTLAFVVAAFALVRVLVQVRRTAAQAEATLRSLDAAIPRLVRTVDQAGEVLVSVRNVTAHAERIAGDVEHVGGKAVKLSSLFVDRVMTPTTQAVAVITGVRTGAMYLLDGWLRRRRAQQNTGGNHHE